MWLSNTDGISSPWTFGVSCWLTFPFFTFILEIWTAYQHHHPLQKKTPTQTEPIRWLVCAWLQWLSGHPRPTSSRWWVSIYVVVAKPLLDYFCFLKVIPFGGTACMMVFHDQQLLPTIWRLLGMALPSAPVDRRVLHAGYATTSLQPCCPYVGPMLIPRRGAQCLAASLSPCHKSVPAKHWSAVLYTGVSRFTLYCSEWTSTGLPSSWPVTNICRFGEGQSWHGGGGVTWSKNSSF